MSGINPMGKGLKDLMAGVGKKEGKEDKRERQPTFALRLEWENGNQASVLYGTLLGGPIYDPSRGIQFVFEGAHARGGWGQWPWGCWMVTITGSNLEGVYWGICESKQSCVREGDNEEHGEKRQDDKPHVTRIAVDVVTIAGYPK